ncbi:unnamed protein product [Microthlaspi erraticum]|uniref:Retrovirus-related Pol polyprotein from transposon TNT 1-94-like beta-barrel domain-containing protein n=1 Tax=Microthlaspi erraticum TaxID=1685480 RepID=A0A6D2HM35_9BRAS|nr:unnamed protein product [Microthlaspi erraticum]
MTGSQENLVNFAVVKESNVTFGCGTLGRIKGKGTILDKELPKLENVYLVKGLTANLISVSQLCDQGLIVSFNKVKCWAFDAENRIILSGIRSENNCYMWEQSQVCLKDEKNNPVFWNEKLEQMNAKSLSKMVSQELVKCVPKMKHGEKIVSEACNEGKDDNSVSQRTFVKNLVEQFMMCSNKSSKTHMSAIVKQICVFISIGDASFIGLGNFWIQLLWRRQMGSKYGMTSDLLLDKCDNQDAIDISGTFVHHSITKTIDSYHLLITNLVEAKQVVIEHVLSEWQFAIIFTKPLDLNTFVHFQKCLGVCELIAGSGLPLSYP